MSHIVLMDCANQHLTRTNAMLTIADREGESLSLPAQSAVAALRSGLSDVCDDLGPLVEAVAQYISIDDD
jgi:hypothetical protein